MPNGKGGDTPDTAAHDTCRPGPSTAGGGGRRSKSGHPGTRARGDGGRGKVTTLVSVRTGAACARIHRARRLAAHAPHAVIHTRYPRAERQADIGRCARAFARAACAPRHARATRVLSNRGPSMPVRPMPHALPIPAHPFHAWPDVDPVHNQLP